MYAEISETGIKGRPLLCKISMSDPGGLVPPRSSSSCLPGPRHAPGRGHIGSIHPALDQPSLAPSLPPGLRARCEHPLFPGCCSHDLAFRYFIQFRVPQNQHLAKAYSNFGGCKRPHCSLTPLWRDIASWGVRLINSFTKNSSLCQSCSGWAEESMAGYGVLQLKSMKKIS